MKRIDQHGNESLEAVEKSILDFETDYYHSMQIDSATFANGLANFEYLIRSYIALDATHSDRHYAEQAFSLLERMKRLNLLQIFREDGDPDSSAIERNRVIFRHQMLIRETVNIKNELHIDSKDIEILRDQLDMLQEAIDSLEDSVRTSDPNFYLFLLLQKPLEISFLRQSCLDDHEVVLDFWIHGNQIFVFMISIDSLQIAQWTAPTEKVRKQIFKLVSPLYQRRDLLQLQFDYPLAHQLYRQLFQPLEKFIHSYTVALIIPDNFLIGFPFEILVADTSSKKQETNGAHYDRLRDLAFLIHKYAFCYNYSVSALSPQFRDYRTTRNLGRRLLTMSEPIITQSSSYSSNQIDEPYFQLNISDYASAEVKRVTRLLYRHDILKRDRVTKKALLARGRLYRWLYLALPGILNNLNPMKSALLFTQEYSDTMVSSCWLTTPEIMKSNLSADLVTLSGCQLMPVNSRFNPGAIALPQSFLYAGAKSVLSSQWRINSISTSEFMSKFYWELKYKRQTNAQALQAAKVASMKDAFFYGGEKISRAHPYFWASFLLIGNPNIRSPYNTKIPIWGVIIIVYGIVFIGTLIITRKTTPRRK